MDAVAPENDFYLRYAGKVTLSSLDNVKLSLRKRILFTAWTNMVRETESSEFMIYRVVAGFIIETNWHIVGRVPRSICWKVAMCLALLLGLEGRCCCNHLHLT